MVSSIIAVWSAAIPGSNPFVWKVQNSMGHRNREKTLIFRISCLLESKTAGLKLNTNGSMGVHVLVCLWCLMKILQLWCVCSRFHRPEHCKSKMKWVLLWFSRRSLVGIQLSICWASIHLKRLFLPSVGFWNIWRGGIVTPAVFLV